MKIVILGAGQGGSSVAEGLVSEKNDITVVDLDPQRLRALQDKLDLRAIAGSASHPSVLVEAGIDAAYQMAGQTMACNLIDPAAQEGVDAFMAKRKPNWAPRS